MLNKKIIASILVITILIGAGTAFALIGPKPGIILNTIENILPGDKDPDTQTNQPKETLTCFDFVDQLLMADGFKYLSGTRWGRGEKNFFLIDVASQEFQIADAYNTHLLADTWFETNFNRQVQYIYRHETGEMTFEYFLRGVPNASDYDRTLYTETKEELADTSRHFYELPHWMNRYVVETERFGCPIVGMSEDQLLGEYKTKMSKAEANDVISSFDVKSTDGVIKYFKDAHKTGRVQDDPRYKELTSLEEYRTLYDADGWEVFYMVGVLYKDPSRLTFESDRNGLSARVIEEFAKDVVYPNTPNPDNTEKKSTLGVYFIYADNPNFKHIYSAPDPNRPLYDNSVGGTDLSNFNMPFEGNIFQSNKGVGGYYDITPLAVGYIREGLDVYLQFVKHINPSIQFSDDFIRNYTRPFDIKWQKQMGLSDFMDAKFGLIDRSVKYLH